MLSLSLSLRQRLCARPPRRLRVCVAVGPLPGSGSGSGSGARARLYSTPPPPPVKLVAELRKRTEVSLVKAREALSASNNDVEAALKWLETDLAESGARKALKVGDRDANQGLIGISVIAGSGGDPDEILSVIKTSPGGGEFGSVRAAIVEVNCETDFVARSDIFQKLVADLAFTASFFSAPPNPNEPAARLIIPQSLEHLNDAPLMDPNATSAPSESSRTVTSAIMETIAKVGEKISLRRVATLTLEKPLDTIAARAAFYLHNFPPPPTDPAYAIPHAQVGNMASLALVAVKTPDGVPVSTLAQNKLFLSQLYPLERSLARQIVGFETRSVRSDASAASSASAEEQPTALYDQPFWMNPTSEGAPVRDVLSKFASETNIEGVEVVEFAKWTVGEELPKEEDAVSTLSPGQDALGWMGGMMAYEAYRNSTSGSGSTEPAAEPAQEAAPSQEGTQQAEGGSLWNWLSDEEADGGSDEDDGGDFDF